VFIFQCGAHWATAGRAARLSLPRRAGVLPRRPATSFLYNSPDAAKTALPHSGAGSTAVMRAASSSIECQRRPKALASGGRPSKASSSTSGWLYRPLRRASASSESELKPGSLPQAAHTRYPKGCIRSWHSSTSTQSRTSRRPAKASTLLVARSKGCRTSPNSSSSTSGKKRNALS